MNKKNQARSSCVKWKRSRACSVTLVSMPATASSVMKSVVMIANSRPWPAIWLQTRRSNCGGIPLRGRRSGAFDSPRTKNAIASARNESEPATRPGRRFPAIPWFVPTCERIPLRGGPRMKPIPNAAPMIPIPLARFSASSCRRCRPARCRCSRRPRRR